MLAALGKALHPIQDSYAQGHTVRELINLPNGMQFPGSISQFQDYSLENHDLHADADDASNPKNAMFAGAAVYQTSEFLKLFKSGASVEELRRWLTEGPYAPFSLSEKCECGGVDRNFDKKLNP